MKKVDTKKIESMTGNFTEWFHEQLKDKKEACLYIEVALELYQQDRDKKALLLAIKDVAQAQGGIAWLAQETELNREHLYYLLSGKGNPRLDTLTLIFQALGMRLQVMPA